MGKQNRQAKEEEETFGSLLERYPFDADAKFAGAGLDESSRARKNPSTFGKESCVVLDLHGKTVKEAQAYLQREIDQLLAMHGVLELKIITGRGRHSEGGKLVLAQHVHRWVQEHYRSSVVSLQECPSESMINGIAVRGYFKLKLRS